MFLKKVSRVIPFLFSLSIFPFIANDAGNSMTEEASSKLVFEKEYKHQLNNFVFLIKVVDVLGTEEMQSTASGMIISSTKSHVFILTADHFCNSEEEDTTQLFKTEIIAYNGDNPRVGQIILSDKENDICLISGIKYRDEKFKNIDFAKKMPPLGEFIFNIAAPNSMGSPNTRLLFDGHFGGCEDICVYTIPATFGSSGSAVFNSKGEIISILVMATPDFENVGIGPDIYTIRNFIKKVEQIMVIK